jgi:RecA/RadA recombinase
MPQSKTEMDTAIEQIRDILEKKKGHLFIEGVKELKSNKVFAPTPISDKLNREKTGLRIKTGTVIDDMIGGGIGVGESCMLYGEYAAGKTQGIFTIIAQCKGYVVMIDCEGTFNLGRIEEICVARGIDFNSLMNRIILFEPKNWMDQLVVARSIPSLEEFQATYGKDAKIDVIVCDSVINYFRGIEFTGRETLPLKTGFLREFLGALKDNAIVHNACVVFTDQISEKPAMTAYTSKSDTQGAVGGHSVTHFPTYNLFFRKGAGNIRAIRMMDSSNNPLCEKAIVINEKGIDDLPKDAKAAKMYAESAKKYDDKQAQETQLPKSLKTAEEVTEEDLEDQRSETGLEATE